jgi:uncharacterized integral membrane protein
MSDSGTNPTDGSGDGGGLSGATIGGLIGVAVLVVFMLQNTERVTLTLLVWDFVWPVWLLVLLSAAIGAGVWFALGVRRRRRRRHERRDRE